MLGRCQEGVRSKFSAHDLREHNQVSPKIGPDPDFLNRLLTSMLADTHNDLSLSFSSEGLLESNVRLRI